MVVRQFSQQGIPPLSSRGVLSAPLAASVLGLEPKAQIACCHNVQLVGMGHLAKLVTSVTVRAQRVGIVLLGL
jgi:hypothetical protein